jgi:FkbM family methyltransferase
MTEWRKNEQPWGTETYAQHGDDLMLVNIFQLLGIGKPSYLDLGAHSPMTISNTALLYLRGSRGVNVEANPSLMPAFHEHRPEDINVNCGVGAKKGVMPFYMWNKGSGINTFSLDEVNWLKNHDPSLQIKEVLQIEVKTIDEILKEYCKNIWPDLLLTDIEGFDHEVLESCDFSSSKPKVVCSEIRPWKAEPTKALMTSKGYFTYCRMQANLIFVQTEFYNKMY